jgi:translation elongation factor EF-1alpha
MVVLNKFDLVGFSEEKYNEIKEKFIPILKRTGFAP